MYKNRTEAGKNNLSGSKIRDMRKALLPSTSQKKFADMLQIQGLDIDKNAIQRMETGERFITDIELKIIAKVLEVSADELLENGELGKET